MFRQYKIVLLFFLSIIAISAPNNTPHWWKCKNRISGSWEFGRAPSLCTLDSFIDRDYVNDQFSDLIFYDFQNRSEEKDRYMNEVYALLKEAATYYLFKRNPTATQTELKYWLKAIYTTAHQESFWTQYRRTSSSNTGQMRSGGDNGHGHGIMQIDDRWHFSEIESGNAANIVKNIIYGLEEYYDGWKRAPSKSCVFSSTDYINRSRAAYSAYNGGSSRICRFTNTSDRWYRNDQGWFNKYKSESWNRYLDNKNLKSSIDVQCIINEEENCRRDRSDEGQEPRSDKIYKLASGHFCTYATDRLNCVTKSEDTTCLINKFKDNFSSNPTGFLNIKKETEDKLEKVVYDRHTLCHGPIKNLYKLGSYIKINKNINLRKTPAGSLVKTIPKNNIMQVLDYHISEGLSQYRYYKVYYNNDYGYIYSGNSETSNSWASKSIKESQDKFIANTRDILKVEREKGVYLLDESGKKIKNFPKGHLIEVEKVSFKGDNNEVYYTPKSEVPGSIFAGSLLPTPNLDQNFKFKEKEVTPPTPKIRYAKLRSRYWWKRYYSCKSSKCKRVGTVLGPRLSSKKFKYLRSSGSWSLIEKNKKRGWIKSRYITKL